MVMTNISTEQIIRQLQLKPLDQEGGFYSRVMESSSRLGQEGRPCFSYIYYLMTPDAPSALHKLDSDEIWQFCLGDPAEHYCLYPDGQDQFSVLGSDITAGCQLSAYVPARVWQGAKLVEGGQFALFGCTVIPAYSSNSYTHGNAEELIQRYPKRKKMIDAFCQQKLLGV
ncbi:MAG: cupin domain-containing protein [Spirochaetales bacterium]|jgi:predicted cupin superfamily sugar epimerase|nr:cupin domain-containing protein [Spirochaetales bacterium]